MGENNNVVAGGLLTRLHTECSPRLNCEQLEYLESTDGDICLVLQHDTYSITLCDHVLGHLISFTVLD